MQPEKWQLPHAANWQELCGGKLRGRSHRGHPWLAINPHCPSRRVVELQLPSQAFVLFNAVLCFAVLCSACAFFLFSAIN